MFDVRPGITGWAQVNGRKGVEWHKRIEFNVWYVDHVSLWLDIKILFKTVFKVFTNADNANTGATVEKENNQDLVATDDSAKTEAAIAKAQVATLSDNVAVLDADAQTEEK